MATRLRLAAARGSRNTPGCWSRGSFSVSWLFTSTSSIRRHAIRPT